MEQSKHKDGPRPPRPVDADCPYDPADPFERFIENIERYVCAAPIE